MAQPYDVIVIGAGLGGLTAAALLARAGRRTLLVERNPSVGGAASTYKVGDMLVEASLHETSDPRDPIDPKHFILDRLGVLDTLEWVPTSAIYEVRGGPVGEPFVLPDGFVAARAALAGRFPSARAGITAVLGDMERIAVGLGTLSRRREAFRNPRQGFGALLKLAPMVRDWRRSVAQVFDRSFGGNEALKCALAANLPYWHDDPDALWWVLFAVAQGGYLASGGRYVRGGSGCLSRALAEATERAGGDIALGRQATAITLGADGCPCGIVHVDREGRDPVEARAPIVVANAAPAVLAAMLPLSARGRFWSAYAGHSLSISLFSATFGLSVRPATLGVRSYATFLLPSWMKTLSDQRRSAALLGAAPGEDRPLITVVDHSAIDSGLAGPPYPVSVVGVDRVANWRGLDQAARDDKRRQWQRAIIAAIDREFPGFASQVVASVFNTALSMHNYLNAPEGAIYGFAPLPPSTPIWRGTGRSPKTPIRGLYLASSYAGSGGFTGAILAGGNAADLVLADGTLESRAAYVRSG
jgi:phytoene dehydrogenase-like protein